MSRIGPSKLTSVDDRIDFSIGTDTKNENQSILDEYLQNHNCEILCGPINLQRCMDLSDQYGSVTLTSPKLFSTKVKTLLVHIKAITDPTKDVRNCNNILFFDFGILNFKTLCFLIVIYRLLESRRTTIANRRLRRNSGWMKLVRCYLVLLLKDSLLMRRKWKLILVKIT